MIAYIPDINTQSFGRVDLVAKEKKKKKVKRFWSLPHTVQDHYPYDLTSFWRGDPRASDALFESSFQIV